MKDVLIGYPCYDNRTDVDIAKELYAMVDDKNSPVGGIQFYNGDSLVTRARNKIAKMFLDQDQFKYLMFIDSDIAFSRDQVKKLRSYDKGICCGVYLKKKLPYQPVLNSKIGEEGELAIYREAGTGFMMIRRDVLGAISAMHPEHHYKADGGELEGMYYDWFRVGVKNGRYLSEDYFFCQLAGELGYKTYVDESILVEHRGKASYPFKDNDLLIGALELLKNWGNGVPFPTEIANELKRVIADK